MSIPQKLEHRSELPNAKNKDDILFEQYENGKIYCRKLVKTLGRHPLGFNYHYYSFGIIFNNKHKYYLMESLYFQLKDLYKLAISSIAIKLDELGQDVTAINSFHYNEHHITKVSKNCFINSYGDKIEFSTIPHEILFKAVDKLLNK